MNWIYVACIISALIISAVSFAAMRREEPRFRSYFRWAIAMQVFGAILPTAWAMWFSQLGFSGARAPGNYTPFIIFLNLFFIAPGAVVMLMGLWESREAQGRQGSLGAGPDRPPRPEDEQRGRI